MQHTNIFKCIVRLGIFCLLEQMPAQNITEY